MEESEDGPEKAFWSLEPGPVARCRFLFIWTVRSRHKAASLKMLRSGEAERAC